MIIDHDRLGNDLAHQGNGPGMANSHPVIGGLFGKKINQITMSI